MKLSSANTGMAVSTEALRTFVIEQVSCRKPGMPSQHSPICVQSGVWQDQQGAGTFRLSLMTILALTKQKAKSALTDKLASLKFKPAGMLIVNSVQEDTRATVKSTWLLAEWDEQPL